MNHIINHIELLGMRVKDSVTGFEGVVSSVTFELYGCIQALVHPGMDKEGKMREQSWFDVNRLVITSAGPVMTPPDFQRGYQAEGKQGAAEKPPYSKS